MSDLKKEYEIVLKHIKYYKEKIDTLKKDKNVMLYLALCDVDKDLASQRDYLYSQIKTKEYESCNHIWIRIPHDNGVFEDYNCCGCIKCGLDERVFNAIGGIGTDNYDQLTLDQQIIYDHMKNRFSRGGTFLGIDCDFDLAKAIYSKVKEAHPDIDDKTAIKYLKSAFYNIVENKVSDERKENRAKRLSLSPDFNNWKKMH